MFTSMVLAMKNRNFKPHRVLNYWLTIIFYVILELEDNVKSVNGNPNCSVDLSFLLSSSRLHYPSQTVIFTF